MVGPTAAQLRTAIMSIQASQPEIGEDDYGED